MRLPQRATTECLIASHFHCYGLCQRLCQQWHGVGDASSQGIRRPQGRSYEGEPDREARFLTDAHGPFEPWERPMQVALAEGQQANPPRGKHEACGMSNRLGNPQSFFHEGLAFSERPALGMTRGELGPGGYGGQINPTEALVAPRAVEERHGLSEEVDRPTRVALGAVSRAEVLVRQ